MPQVTIFTNHGCSACRAAKQFFNEHGGAYIERNIGDDREARDDLIRQGFRAVPVIRIGEETMVGFSAMKLRRMLGLQSSFRLEKSAPRSSMGARPGDSLQAKWTED